MAADHGQARAVKVTCAPPHGVEEGLFFGPADALLEIKTDRHPSRAAGGHVKPVRNGQVRGNHFVEMFLQVAFLENRAVLQVGRAVNTFGPEAGAQKVFLIVRAIAGGVMQRGAQLFELVVLDVLEAPGFAGGREFFEFAVARAVAPALGQLPIGGPDHGLQPARQGVVGIQERIKLVFQAHGRCGSR